MAAADRRGPTRCLWEAGRGVQTQSQDTVTGIPPVSEPLQNLSDRSLFQTMRVNTRPSKVLRASGEAAENEDHSGKMCPQPSAKSSPPSNFAASLVIRPRSAMQLQACSPTKNSRV